MRLRSSACASQIIYSRPEHGGPQRRDVRVCVFRFSDIQLLVNGNFNCSIRFEEACFPFPSQRRTGILNKDRRVSKDRIQTNWEVTIPTHLRTLNLSLQISYFLFCSFLEKRSASGVKCSRFKPCSFLFRCFHKKLVLSPFKTKKAIRRLSPLPWLRVS